jgi:glycogen synthase
LIYNVSCAKLTFKYKLQAPLYWDVYANLGFNSARICFTCHNFEYQGTAPARDLAACGLDVEHLDRPDRMRDNSHGRINVVKVPFMATVAIDLECKLTAVVSIMLIWIHIIQGAIVYSNIVTTVSPTYALEVRSEVTFLMTSLPCKAVSQPSFV